MRSFDPKDHPIPFVHQLLLSCVAPRPIAFVTSMDEEGRFNLSPFSYFNAFGANPPVVAVSPAYRGTNGTPKHTFLNVTATGEFTVSMVSHAILEQANLASAEYPAGVNEYGKAGFTERPSVIVRPPGVAESPCILECRLLHYIELGGKPASGNLLIGEVVMFHVKESAYTEDRIDPRRLDLVARMGHNWYCRANGDALFELPKPKDPVIGYDTLPEHLRRSEVLTGNDLGKLAVAHVMPDVEEILTRWRNDLERVSPDMTAPDMFDVELNRGEPHRALMALFVRIRQKATEPTFLARDLQRCAQAFLKRNEVERAWECALMANPEIVRTLLG